MIGSNRLRFWLLAGAAALGGASVAASVTLGGEPPGARPSATPVPVPLSDADFVLCQSPGKGGFAANRMLFRLAATQTEVPPTELGGRGAGTGFRQHVSAAVGWARDADPQDHHRRSAGAAYFDQGFGSVTASTTTKRAARSARRSIAIPIARCVTGAKPWCSAPTSISRCPRKRWRLPSRPPRRRRRLPRARSVQ